MSDVRGIVLFGVLVLLWALALPTRWKPPRNAADFWYDVLTGIGGILFFIGDADQREKVALAQEFNEQKAELESFRDNRPIEKRFKIGQPGLDVPTPGDSMCEDLKWQPTLDLMAKARTADELASLLIATDVGRLERAVGINLGQLGLARAVRYLIAVLAGGPVAQELANEESSLRAKLKDASTRNESIGRALYAGVHADALRDLLWPYVLLTAFGLKLASVTSCGPNRIDD